MSEEIAISIEESRDYQTGNFLNAVDDLSKYFMHQQNLSECAMAKALRLYADSLEALD